MIGAFVGLPLLILSQDSQIRFGKLQGHLGLDALWKPIFALAVLLWSVILTMMLLGLGHAIFDLIFAATPQGRDEIWDFRFAIARLTGLTATLGGALALPFTLIRLRLTKEANETTEQGQITDRINSAVEGLGAEKIIKIDREESTAPNIEVRIGSILALERISRKNTDFHIQIVEILCAYVRLNSPASTLKSTENLKKRPQQREDIDLCIKVLGRRSTRNKQQEYKLRTRLDLRNCDLSGVDFRKGDYSGALFHHSNLEAALMRDSKFIGAQFHYCVLSYVDLFQSELTGAYMDYADLSFNGNLVFAASLRGVSFVGANLQGDCQFVDHDDFKYTFGTSDTRLREEYNTIRDRTNRRRKTKLSREHPSKILANVDEFASLIEENPFIQWPDWTSTDLATPHLYNKLLTGLELKAFPVGDT